MKLNDFMNIVASNISLGSVYKLLKGTCYIFIDKNTKPTPKDLIYKDWRAYGFSDKYSSSHIEGDEEPPFDDLHKILKIVCPQITLIQYCEFINNLLSSKTIEMRGYYGDVSVYKIQYISVENLYTALKNLELI